MTKFSNDAQKVLITGASGFIGRCLVATLVAAGADVKAAIRNSAVSSAIHGAELVVVGNIDATTDWKVALNGVNCVVHLAARVHVMQDNEKDLLAEFQRVNVLGTMQLARQAVDFGVSRFVFISSVGVNGAETFGDPFTVDDAAVPHSAYAQSKYEAELELKLLSDQTGLEVVIIRSPLVYGPNAPGNFGSLQRWLERGLPLPLGAIYNKRSLVELNNLVDLIIKCTVHSAAANQTFLVSDGEDISTSELIRRIGNAIDRPAWLISIPASWLKFAAAVIGKRDVAQRLCGSLQVDIAKTRRVLGWTAPLSVDAGLALVAEDFLRLQQANPTA